jgi:hypothetical protein
MGRARGLGQPDYPVLGGDIGTHAGVSTDAASRCKRPILNSKLPALPAQTVIFPMWRVEAGPSAR